FVFHSLVSEARNRRQQKPAGLSLRDSLPRLRPNRKIAFITPIKTNIKPLIEFLHSIVSSLSARSVRVSEEAAFMLPPQTSQAQNAGNTILSPASPFCRFSLQYIP
ncbi:MAG TPA: hypothetical protein VN042_08265, partial [Asticcacaulis sp.]|nr:hypothetical protein [Asticcacaulis sp.]